MATTFGSLFVGGGGGGAETDPITGAISGIVKGDGAGNISAAVEDTDYQGVPSEGAFADGDKTKLDGIESGADDSQNTLTPVNSPTGAYTILSSDHRKLVRVDNTVTIPTGLSVGFECTIHNTTGGTVALTTTGLTVNGNDAAANISADGIISFIVIATNTILVSGEME